MDATIHEIVSRTLDGIQCEITRNAYGVEINFILSYIKQQAVWRIDTRVNDIIVSRKHFPATNEFVKALKIIGLQ